MLMPSAGKEHVVVWTTPLHVPESELGRLMDVVARGVDDGVAHYHTLTIAEGAIRAVMRPGESFDATTDETQAKIIGKQGQAALEAALGSVGDFGYKTVAWPVSVEGDSDTL